MSFDYINTAYGLSAAKGQRIEYTGGPVPREGVITGADGHRLLIKLDGEAHSRRYHPTWELRILADTKAKP